VKWPRFWPQPSWETPNTCLSSAVANHSCKCHFRASPRETFPPPPPAENQRDPFGIDWHFFSLFSLKIISDLKGSPHCENLRLQPGEGWNVSWQETGWNRRPTCCGEPGSRGQIPCFLSQANLELGKNNHLHKTGTNFGGSQWEVRGGEKEG
jgi:hypothetical protein